MTATGRAWAEIVGKHSGEQKIVSNSAYFVNVLFSSEKSCRSQSFLESFAEYPLKQTQWERFLDRSGLSDAPMKLLTVVETLNTFLTPLLSAAEAGGEYNQVWQGGGPWWPSEVLGGSDETG